MYNVHQLFYVFIRAREAKWHLAASLYFPQYHALEFESKGHFDMSNWLIYPTLTCFRIRKHFQNFSQTVSLVHAWEKRQQYNLSFDKQSTQSANKKNDEKLASAQYHVSYDRNCSCSCYILPVQINAHLNCLWG